MQGRRHIHHTVIHRPCSPSHPCGSLRAGVRGCPRGVAPLTPPSEEGPPWGRLREDNDLSAPAFLGM
jgi:hypothetical protein